MNYKIEIIHDEFAENPRNEFDNLGTMVCFHRDYNLGDTGHGYNKSDFNSWQELEKQIIKDHDPAVILPIYMYDHSGITISTSSFSCRWDSGQIGFIYISKDKVRKECNVKRINKELLEDIKKALESEVETYDNYITGSCYGYQIIKDGEVVDSCWGYYGWESAKQAADEQIMYYNKVKEVAL